MAVPERLQPRRRRGFASDLSQLLQAGVGLLFLYSLIAHVVNEAYALLWRTKMAVPAAAAAGPLATLVGVRIPLPNPLAEIIIVCIVLGVVTYYVLQWICQQEWVQELVQVEECWEETTWYNPWSWVEAIVCTVKEVLKWILKLICGWIWVAVIGLVILCIILGIIIAFG